MSSTLRMSRWRFIVVIAVMAFTLFAHAQSAEKVSSSGGAREKLVGAWHLVHIDAPGTDGKSVPVPQPKGILIYTRDGHMSVQLMYPESAEEAEAQRATQVNSNFGHVTPGLVQNTTDLLFRDLWLRPALAPRDRSLVTVSALIASGQVRANHVSLEVLWTTA